MQCPGKCLTHRSILKGLLENVLQEENKRKQKWDGILNKKQRDKNHLLLNCKAFGFKCTVRTQVRLKINKLSFQLKKHQKMLTQNLIDGRT